MFRESEDYASNKNIFEGLVAVLQRHSKGKFVVISDEEVVGIESTIEDAEDLGIGDVGDGKFDIFII